MIVNLKNKAPSDFTCKNEFIQEEQRTAIWDKQAMEKTIGESTKQRRGILLRRKPGRWEGRYTRKVHWGNWELEHNGPSLAEL